MTDNLATLRVNRSSMSRWTGAAALAAFTLAACLMTAGCTSTGRPLDALPRLAGGSGSSAALSKAVEKDPFPTAAQAGLASRP